MTQLAAQPPGERLAVVIDARSGSFLMGLEPALALVRQAGVRPTTLFLDASDGVLVQRFKETRRKHPLFEDQGGILGSIRAERSLLEDIKEGADKVVDTSDMDGAELRNLLLSEFAPAQDKNQGLIVTVNSFGFKYGLPLDADLVFDVRFLINPHYVDDLRPYDGRNQIIEEYVMRDPDSGLFLGKLYDLDGLEHPALYCRGQGVSDCRHRLHGRTAPIRRRFGEARRPPARV